MPAFEGTETVLVVDDKSFIVSLAHEMLTTYGYRALAVNSAAEAIHLFESSPNLDVDLALLDIVMPEMTGTDLALRLKQIRPSLPIVFMSAYSESPMLRPERYGKIISLRSLSRHLHSPGRSGKYSTLSVRIPDQPAVDRDAKPRLRGIWSALFGTAV